MIETRVCAVIYSAGQFMPILWEDFDTDRPYPFTFQVITDDIEWVEKQLEAAKGARGWDSGM